MIAVAPRYPQNAAIAHRLEEVGRLLEEQGANRFRVRAYQAAAATMRRLDRPAAHILEEEGVEGLTRLPTIGPTLARLIRDMVRLGRSPILERLRGELDPVSLLRSVPGIGPTLADRVHEELGVETLEELEAAAHDGRLEGVAGFGPRRVRGVADSLAGRLQRVRRRLPVVNDLDEAPVGEVLDVDHEYRRKAEAHMLPLITPRRFNPAREAWLPVLHTERGARHYTALFSNTALAHRLGRTHDWVVIYSDGGRAPERQYTVVTARQGVLRGHRIVRGRERECWEHYRLHAHERDAPPTPEPVPAAR